MDTRAFGIVGCITPTGIPYMTTRGGPLCGLESLALQGLPLERLLLTRETQRELQDLAGNAMSSTVVGAAILSALIVGHKALERGEQEQSHVDCRKPHLGKEPSAESCQYVTTPRDLKLGEAVDMDLARTQSDAVNSARYCICERQSMVKHNILKCTSCGHTACSSCAGNPTHLYERLQDTPRIQPLDFIHKLKKTLPMRLVLSNLHRDDYNTFKTDPSCRCPEPAWEKFLNAVTRAVGDELHFQEVKRSGVWTVIYEGRFAVLGLTISATGLRWHFFAKPAHDEPALCLIREILSKPIAKMTPIPGSLLEGSWEVCSPLSYKSTLQIRGTGKQIDSLESKCGLEKPPFFGSKVWSHLRITGSDVDVKNLELDIRGDYELLPNCGTANAALHKKLTTESLSPPVFLFLDPTKLGLPEHDSFVFSQEHDRIADYSSRSTIAEVSHKWRSWSAIEVGETVNIFYRNWTAVENVNLRPYHPQAPIECEVLDPKSVISVRRAKCHEANVTLLQFAAPAETIESLWEPGPWQVTDLMDSSALLGDFSWLLQRGASFCDFRDWNDVVKPIDFTDDVDVGCKVCVPRKPRILWGRYRGSKLRAYEDPHDAALYERQVKARPAPFLAFRRVNELGHGCFRVTFNIQTLLHRAHDKLVSSGSSNSDVSLSWRLVSNAHDLRDFEFPKFQLTSNRDDPRSLQPPGMQIRLRPEQLRSLSWMVAQEADDTPPFEEEEVEEALLPLMMWRAECRASSKKTVRGGVLADQVGYGKTALILGLIDTQFEKDHLQVLESDDGHIPTNATLIVVPRIMIYQWKSEIEKFLGTKYNVLVLSAVSSLPSKTIRDIQNADIILVSSGVLNSATYYQKMQAFTGAPRVPVKAGRNFDQWFEDTRNIVTSHARTLQNQGPQALLGSIRAKRRAVREAEANHTYVPSRRLRGKQLAAANVNKEANERKGVQYADISSEDEGSDGSDAEDTGKIIGKVDSLLYLRPLSPIASNKNGGDGTDAPDEGAEEADTEYENSSSESPCAKEEGRTKRKRDEAGATKSTKKQWNDRKQFNIKRDEPNQVWTSVKSPILHAFTFPRVIIDEFTYADPGRIAPLLSLSARSKWVLSGTPPLNDFSDVNTIAPFLGVHLGIDDDDGGAQTQRRLKAANKHQSDAEKFQSFKAPASQAWHRRRHELAQTFLNRFVRQNVAEIDEIPSTEHIVLVRQSPAERAIYLELYKQLMAQNRQLRRGGKGRFSNDQVRRMEEVIAGSASPEEALLKRCSSLALLDRWDGGRPEAVTCGSVLGIREAQLVDLQEDLRDKLRLAAWLYSKCGGSHVHFDKFKESVRRHDFGDMAATIQICPLIDEAIRSSREEDWTHYFADPRSQKESESFLQSLDDSRTPATAQRKELKQLEEAGVNKPPPKKAKPNPVRKRAATGTKTASTETAKKKRESPTTTKEPTSFAQPNKPTKTEAFETILRDVTTTLRSLVVESVVRERALRFLKTVRLLQTYPESARCDSCDRAETCGINQDDLDSGDVNVLGSCGHMLCEPCTVQTVEHEECRVTGCRGSGKPFNVMNNTILGRDNQNDDKSAKYGGRKLDKLVELLQCQQQIPENEKVVLFIQFPDLMGVVCHALELAGIRHTSISALDRHAARKMENFQTSSFGDKKVLVLNLGSEMAAGL